MGRYAGKTAALILVALCASGTAIASITLDGEEMVFRLVAPSAKSVFLVGDFNGWNPTIDKLVELDGRFEIRLYLLPGRYRYRFLVDGVSMPDPDNPYRDTEANSYFILRETRRGYEIVYRESEGPEYGIEALVATLSGGVTAITGSDSASVFVGCDLHGRLDKYAEAGLDFGYDFTTRWEGDARGRAYLVRGSALYRIGDRSIKAFNRLDELDLGDPLGLFGRIGPFGYPLGLFSRGILFDGTLLFGTKGRAFYASRINGYRSGLETFDQTGTGGTGVFGSRDLTDSDLIGVKASGRWRRLRYSYLYRRDRRAKEGTWSVPYIEDRIFKGFESLSIHGFCLSLEDDHGLRLDAEYLRGRSRLAALERGPVSGVEFEGFEVDYDWERSYRLFAGVSVTTERTALSLGLRRTVLKGARALREGRPPADATAFDADASLSAGDITVAVGASIESFSSGNTGDVFWVQRRNFWLDGDALTISRIPFLYERTVYDVRCELALNYPDDANEMGLRATVLHRGTQAGRDPHVTELVLGSSIPLTRWMSILCDLRFVSYGHHEWSGGNDFLNTFLGLKGRMFGAFWCTLGVGVNPRVFDRWYYAFADQGRERYLLAKGVFDAVESEDIMEILREAEEALSDELGITFEAGMEF
ncbi:MAG: glycogen-binding domain-containing protein [bacterium]|nr:MAG: glycogen-binding domain-containing protein [bacterium]